jgi:hypothetical protein
MHNRPAAASKRRPLILAFALASLTSLALLQHVELATAKPGATCQDKHHACTKRCIDQYDKGVNDNYAAYKCVSRTCDKQFDNCVREMGQNKGGSGGKVALPSSDGRPTIGSGPFSSIPSGGLLNTSPNLPGQGPSAIGSPVGGPRAPSAPPVIIR